MEDKLGGGNKDTPKKTSANIVGIYPIIPIITSNVIALNTPVKTQIVTTVTHICTHLHSQDTEDRRMASS